ncbi:hypothetical protein [Lelliottia amnigena]|uniref:hypothetical protein n=1 Tax=Lelliottia amnigena TaxID=61646 RepID=UPI004057C659
MKKGNFRLIAFVPMFVMYFGFPLIRDVVPFHDIYTYQEWFALLGMYVIGTLVAAPLIYLLIKDSGKPLKLGLTVRWMLFLLATLQVACMYYLWEQGAQLYLSMAITMGIISAIYAYGTKSTNIMRDKDTGNFYRVHRGKAHRLSEHDVQRYMSGVIGTNISPYEFSSSAIAGFDSHASENNLNFNSSMFGSDNFSSGMSINPSSGSPMVGGISGHDISGNSWGTNFNEPTNTYDPNRGY